RVAKERALVKALADRGRSPGDMREVCKPDLPGQHGRLAFSQLFQLFSGADPIRGGAAGHMAIGFDPGDGAVEALLVVLLGLGELGRKAGEVELELIHRQPDADHLRRDLGSGFGYKSPLPSYHAYIIRTSVCRSSKSTRLVNSRGQKLAPPGRIRGRPPRTRAGASLPAPYHPPGPAP